MKKRWAVASAVAAVATVGSVSTAGAIPNKEGTLWTCEGDEVLIIEAGRNGWINGEHYQAVFIEFIETFTPEGGGEPDVEGEQKFYGNRGNLVHPEAIRCDVHFEETIPGEGTFVADGHVIAIPVN